MEITSSQAYGFTNSPLPGGLCDPRMGPANDRDPPCPTCGLRKQSCPGHFGHIELAVPVHHPLLINEILTLLRCKCLVCHRLRAPPRQLALYRAKFNLLYQGRIDELHSLDTQMQVALSKRGDDKLSTVESARILDEVLREYQPKNNNPNGTNGTSAPSRSEPRERRYRKLNSHERRERNTLIKDCLAACRSTMRCPHCGAYSPKIRQDSSNKFFRGILSARHRVQNRLDGLKVESALVLEDNEAGRVSTSNPGGDSTGGGSGYQSDDSETRRRLATRDDDDEEDMEQAEDEDGSGEKKEQDHFMHTKEVQAQMKRTWKTDPYLLSCLFGSGDCFDENGYKIFFLQVVPVPPNKFRPSLEMMGSTVEHSQNQYLSKVIQLNESVRDLFAKGNESQAYTTWINLQTTINCYMDSSKDPSSTPIHLVAPGIRQILERKEGLFRKNMMGKRVDFACRSVISPDPYVGANEIGLPLYFATVLTYPTPVTHLNVKEMRTLVERGPAKYPGARWVQMPDTGQRIDLSRMKTQQRTAIAAMLLANVRKSGGRPTIVGRQLRDGDYVLMNRQVRACLEA